MLILFFLFQENHAQSKYGNATPDELNMTVYPQDTTASAVFTEKDCIPNKKITIFALLKKH
jgi:hypothetical protein